MKRMNQQATLGKRRIEATESIENADNFIVISVKRVASNEGELRVTTHINNPDIARHLGQELKDQAKEIEESLKEYEA